MLDLKGHSLLDRARSFQASLASGAESGDSVHPPTHTRYDCHHCVCGNSPAAVPITRPAMATVKRRLVFFTDTRATLDCRVWCVWCESKPAARRNGVERMCEADVGSESVQRSLGETAVTNALAAAARVHHPTRGIATLRYMPFQLQNAPRPATRSGHRIAMNYRVNKGLYGSRLSL